MAQVHSVEPTMCSASAVQAETPSMLNCLRGRPNDDARVSSDGSLAKESQGPDQPRTSRQPSGHKVSQRRRTLQEIEPPRRSGLPEWEAGAGDDGSRDDEPFFSRCPEIAPDAVFDAARRCREDTNPKAVNLTIGAYRTEEDKPYVLKTVIRAEELRLEKEREHVENKEYLPITGLPSLKANSQRLLLGDDEFERLNPVLAGAQSISGTGALSLGASFLAEFNKTSVLLPNRTWGNHRKIFLRAGFSNPRNYRYWDPKKRGLNIEGMIEDLSLAPPLSIVVLHACAHNPTGCDPTRDEWRRILEVVKVRRLLPFFDIAYQGFATGDLDADAWAVREFTRADILLLVAQSYSKNMGLYGERCGMLSVVTSSAQSARAVTSQLAQIARTTYSNPPKHGAFIVNTILSDRAEGGLYDQWCDELQVMSQRLKTMRTLLQENLVKHGAPGTWDHITSQIGMFAFTGLLSHQVEALEKEHHIYMLKNGRISLAGLNHSNVEYFAECVATVLKEDAKSD